MNGSGGKAVRTRSFAGLPVLSIVLVCAAWGSSSPLAHACPYEAEDSGSATAAAAGCMVRIGGSLLSRINKRGIHPTLRFNDRITASILSDDVKPGRDTNNFIGFCGSGKSLQEPKHK